jgi:hypothetical protein
MYIKQVDEDNGNDVSGSSSFERIPVQSQIFDILLYAHRAHSSPTFMLADIRRVGMVSQISWNFPSANPDQAFKIDGTDPVIFTSLGRHYIPHGGTFRAPLPLM